MEEIAPKKVEDPEYKDAVLQKIGVRIQKLATYLGCGAEADDIAQETLLLLHKRYREDKPELLVLRANRICVNLVRNNRRRRDHAAMTDLVAGSAQDAHLNPEELFRSSEMVQSLIEILAKSDPVCRKLLRYELEGVDIAEISAALGLRPGAVYTAQHRCRKRMRQILESLR